MTQKIILPIDSHRSDFEESLRQNQVVILKAAPGTGKTTRVPTYLAERLDAEKQIIVLEPRRLAARLSAERISDEAGSEVGAFCGYQIRYDKKFTAASRIVFVTEGIFIRWLASNPELLGISCVVLDEFHERNLQTDMALAFCLNLLKKKRPDLKLVIMSATLDTAALEKHVGSCGVLDIAGQHYPVDITYAPPKPRESLEESSAVAAMALLNNPKCSGNILIFHSGAAAINRTVGLLKSMVEAKISILPLYSSMPARDQKLVFESGGSRKIVVATNVAETSLTLPGITGVVDCGESKVAGHTPWSGMPTLEVKRISQASAIQRAGRAGRTSPGVVVRIYEEADYLRSEPFTIPEIKRVDLGAAILQAMVAAECVDENSGAEIFDALPWFELPDERSVESTMLLLRRLGCIDEKLRITKRGQFVSSLPLHPRLGAILDARRGHANYPDIILAAMMIAEGVFVSRNERSKQATPSDLAYGMDHIKNQIFDLDWDHWFWPRPLPATTLKRLASSIKQLSTQLKVGAISNQKTNLPELAESLLVGYGDRVAKIRAPLKGKKRNQSSKLFISFCLGRGGEIAECSTLHKAEWIIVIDATERLKVSDAAKATVAWQCVGISSEQLLADPMQLISTSVNTAVVARGRVEATEQKMYGQLLHSEIMMELSSRAGAKGLFNYMMANWPQPFPNEDDLELYHCKVRHLQKSGSEGALPLFDGEFREILIDSITAGKKTFEEITERSLMSYLIEQLTWQEQQQLAKLPDEIRLTNGKVLGVSYDESGATITGFIQDFFGLKNLPTLGENISVRFVFIGPNKRPAQITNDWDGFWTTTYFALKSELQRKYPRHHWPDDPINSIPVLTKKQFERS